MKETRPEIVAVYADGGCIGRNPSPLGGTWAYCCVDGEDRHVHEQSGIVTIEEVAPLEQVTNNVSELVALCRAILACSAGFRGTIYSDSHTSILRVGYGARLNGVPPGVCHLLETALRHTATFQTRGPCYVLLDGHPSRKQLERGIGQRGNPVSLHNVWCDAECTRRAREFMATGKDE